MAKGITPRAQDFSAWYNDCCAQAELAEHAPVRGCMVIRPYGYAIWERLQSELDRRIKATGAKNAYFPMFIPESFMTKEKEHVEGFSPECAVVTHGGGKKLEEPLFVRPTSETIINHMFAKWVSSWRDLPLMINQWCNVVRWEMRPRLFLRTTEFLWQEGHTAHATEKEAIDESLKMLEVYRAFAEEVLAIPVVAGEKSSAEKFAGAQRTFTIEALMQDGKALQAGTSHFLGQTFSTAFGIRFQDAQGKLEHAWQTSWGVSTRLVGAIIMTHGDDNGLVLPPSVAPVQVVIVPIWREDADKARVFESVAGMKLDLEAKGLRVEADLREEYKPGWKFFHWEVRGVPVRLEIGPRDLAAGQAVLVRRDNGAKENVMLSGLAEKVASLMPQMQKGILDKARAFVASGTRDATDFAALKAGVEEKPGFYRAGWCGSGACEAKIKEETKATLRCMPMDSAAASGACVVCNAPAKANPLFARNY